MDSNQKRFAVDALDLLNELDEALMQLEVNPGATAPLEQLFRTVHTIKGAANMFGFVGIGELAHHLETPFDLVRQGRMLVSDQLISLTLQAFDKVRDLLKEDDINIINSSVEIQNFIKSAKEILFQTGQGDELIFADHSASNKSELATFFIKIDPLIAITPNGNHPLIYIVQDIEANGTYKTFLTENDKGEVGNWAIFLATTTHETELESNFLFVDQECKAKITRLAPGNLFDNEAFRDSIENFNVATFDISTFLGFTPGVLTGNTDDEIENIAGKKTENDTIIKVSKRKIDELLDWISELIILQTQIANIAAGNGTKGLEDASEHLEMITNRLRDTSLGIGLVPIETLVTKFKRLVRDLSKSLGKKVNFVSEGTDTEMDKDIIEMIAEPVMHILRNAIDHGLESPEERKLLSKTEHGTIKLIAFNSSAYANLIISDDGKGIDSKKVLSKAILKGIIATDAQPTDDEILNLIFRPGLSTADEVSDVSGRGVGMDVVQQRINELRGSVTVKSVPNRGTAIHIKLPLSRSIIEGLLLSVDDSKYVIPLYFVDRIDRINSEQIEHTNKLNKTVVINNMPLAIFSLRKYFGHPSESQKTSDVISVIIDGNKKGIAVDKIEGKIQAVLKPLGEIYQQQDYLSGSTILGDGTLALVLDPPRLFKIQN